MEGKAVSLKGRNLMLAIPAYDGKLAISSAYTLPSLGLDAVKYGFELHMSHVSNCSIITRARNMLVKQFMDSGCTDLLFVDADIHFKAQDVVRIMAMSDDKDVVAGAYPRRSGEGGVSWFADIAYGPSNEVYLDDGLLRVNRIGTGFMLIRRHVLEKLHNDHPEWRYHVDLLNEDHYSIFDFKSDPSGYIGEDYLFCDRVREAGFRVHLDPDINLGHYGQQEFTGNFRQQALAALLGTNER